MHLHNSGYINMESSGISSPKGKCDYVITHHVRSIMQEGIESTPCHFNKCKCNLRPHSCRSFFRRACVRSTSNFKGEEKRWKNKSEEIASFYYAKLLFGYTVTRPFLHFHWIIDENLQRLLTFNHELCARAWLSSFFFAFIVLSCTWWKRYYESSR